MAAYYVQVKNALVLVLASCLCCWTEELHLPPLSTEFSRLPPPTHLAGLFPACDAVPEFGEPSTRIGNDKSRSGE
jgi:hypothetical protein